MKWLAKWMCLMGMALFGSDALAQSPGQQARRPFSQAELDQMLAPIALYPDSLLSQILMAATYPRDVAEAASWSRANAALRGDDAVRAAQNEPWDPSVISITAFPQVLAMMGQRRSWVERLGEAYIEQPQQVMDTIQGLRARADGAGNLRSSEEMIVQRESNDYTLEAPTPEVVHVPYYDPRVAYGDWAWPEYQPVYWRPWAGYNYDPGYSGFGWGYGITIGSGFYFGAIDWPRRYLRYSHHRPWYHHGRDWRNGHRWTHNRDHRRDVRDYRGRDGDRNRWRDGNPNTSRDGNRDGRQGNRGDRAESRDLNRTPRPQTERAADTRPDRRVPQQGYMPRTEDTSAQGTVSRNPAVRSVAPRYSIDGGTGVRVQPRERVVREQPTNGIERPAQARVYSEPRAPPVQQAPANQRYYAAPVHQAAPAPAPAPAPQPSSNPAARSTERAPAPSSSSGDSPAPSPPSRMQRGGGRER